MARSMNSGTSSKRNRQQRQAWSHGSTWLGSIAVMTLLVGVGYRLITDAENFVLRKVSVVNELKHLDRGELERVVAESIVGNFFTVDMTALRDRVQQLAWVDHLTIRRAWPQTLTMQVIEQVPLARWGGDALVNISGEVFYPENANRGATATPLIELFGPDHRSDDVVSMYRAATALLEPTGLVITRFGLDERREWIVEFDKSDLRVALGVENVVTRLKRFASAYSLLINDPARRPMVVDLRYAQGFAVSWRMNDQVTNDQMTTSTTGREGDT